MSTQFTTSRRIEFCDTDMAGIMHFTNYFRLMEQAEHDFFRSVGLETYARQDDGSVISWPRVSSTCEFKAPALFNDVVELRLRISKDGPRTLVVNCDFVRDGTLLAVGQMHAVCCRLRPGERMRSIDIPPDYVERIFDR